LAGVDHEMQRGTAFPPARVVIVFRHLVEAELLVVVGADPFGGVDRALLEGGINVAARELLGHATELLDGAAGKAADAELEPDEVLRRLELLAEPPAHLRAGVAADQRINVVLLAELDEQLLAVAVGEPGVLLAAVEAERDRAEQREGRILADEII